MFPGKLAELVVGGPPREIGRPASFQLAALDVVSESDGTTASMCSGRRQAMMLTPPST
jgi:hypothetical protein